MTTQPDIDSIAREAVLADCTSASPEESQKIIAAAIRRAQGETYPNLFQELSRQITELKSERDRLDQENKDMAKAMALKTRLERHLSEAISERDALVKISEAANELESLLRKNTGRTDDWPIEIKVSGDYAQTLAEKLTVLTRALKPYREKMK